MNASARGLAFGGAQKISADCKNFFRLTVACVPSGLRLSSLRKDTTRSPILLAPGEVADNLDVRAGERVTFYFTDVTKTFGRGPPLCASRHERAREVIAPCSREVSGAINISRVRRAAVCATSTPVHAQCFVMRVRVRGFGALARDSFMTRVDARTRAAVCCRAADGVSFKACVRRATKTASRPRDVEFLVMLVLIFCHAG